MSSTVNAADAVYAARFARELIAERRKRGISQYRLARLAQPPLDASSITRIENQTRFVSRASVEAIIAGLDLTGSDADRMRLSAGFAPKHDVPTKSLVRDKNSGRGRAGDE